MRLALFLCLFALPAAAQDGVRASDQRLDQSALASLLTGQVIEFYDGSKSRYGADGRYGYTYTDDGPVWAGDYTIGDDSEVCVAFDNGSARCDTIVMKWETIVLITTDGLRFPVRNQSVAAE